MFAATSLGVLSDLPLQEVEPGCYSIAFGDPRLLEGRIQVICRHDSKQLHLQRIVEYKHDQHLLDCSRSSGAEHQPGDLERACQQVRGIYIWQCDVLAVSGLLQCGASAWKPAPPRGKPALTRHPQWQGDSPACRYALPGAASSRRAACIMPEIPACNLGQAA